MNIQLRIFPVLKSRHTLQIGCRVLLFVSLVLIMQGLQVVTIAHAPRAAISIALVALIGCMALLLGTILSLLWRVAGSLARVLVPAGVADGEANQRLLVSPATEEAI